MDLKLKKIASQLAAFWKSLNKKKKIAILGSFAGFIILLTVILILANHVTYSALYLGLDASEAGEIYDQVEEMGVAEKIEGTGNLYVDSRKVDEVKMKLAESGYPKTALTYDIFEKSSDWATTDSARDTYKLYQLQDRLQTTIETINGVENAIVTIAQGDNSSYVLSTDETPVTASVKLTLAAGTGLTSQQVKGIELLVAQSVPDLTQSNVAVIDSDGSPLSGDDSSTTTTSRLQLQQKVESTIKEKILSILEPVFGSGQVKVAATATMDFSTSTINKTTYAANSATGTGIPQTETETVQGNTAAATASGVAGVSGVPSYTSSGTSSAVSGSGTVTSRDTTYLVDTINEQIKDDGGKVSNITVAVVLNSASSAAATNQNTLRQTVAYALGINPANVSIQLASFAGTGNSVTVNTTPQLISNKVMIAVGVGLAVFLVFLTVFALMSVSKARRTAAKFAQTQTEQAGELPDGAADAEKPENENDIEKILAPPQSATQKQVEEFVDSKPELVAQILRNWLKEQQ